MIEIPRALVRTFRGILRQSVLAESPRDGSLPIRIQSGPAGLLLEACRGHVALRYEHPGGQSTAEVVLALSGLMGFEGTTNEVVVIDPVAPAKARARWHNAGVPRSLELTCIPPDRVSPFPDMPSEMEPLPGTFVVALGEAAHTAASFSTRYALNTVCLRGKHGQVVATDGRQLLIQGGFPLPWPNDVLVPRVLAFASRPLSGIEEVAIGRTDAHVVVRAGPWTFALGIAADARFPDVECVIPRRSSTRLTLHPEDTTVLREVLPNLPGDKEDTAPITLDLTNPPVVRAREGNEGPAAEVELPQSIVSGPALRVVIDRRYLHRAARLGFTEVLIASADKPLVARDDLRTYLWMPLSPNSAIAPGPDVARVTSWPTNGTPAPSSPPTPKRRIEPMADRPIENGSPPRNGTADRVPTLDDLFNEAEALRGLLQESQTRLARLGGGLKSLRKHGRALQAAVESLRNLQLTP